MNKPEAVTIHMATPEDASAIATLAQELADFEGVVSHCDEEAVHRMMLAPQSPSIAIKVARLGTEVVGFALYYAGYDVSTASYGFHLADICVTETMRRKGIGRKLMASIAEHALVENRRWVSLTMLHSNETAKQFYQSLHMIPVPVQMMAIGASGLQSIHSQAMVSA